MDHFKDRIDYNAFLEYGTGSYEKPTDTKIIEFPFDKYIVVIELTKDNKFLNIIEIKINKSFLDYEAKRTLYGYHDVREFYKE